MNYLEVKDRLKKHLLGQRIVSAEEDTLTLGNGTTLTLFESDWDCCAGAFGEWEILNPDNIEAGITDVDFLVNEWESPSEEYGTSAVITILHNQNPLAVGECEANAGNGGYYFSVLSLRVSIPEGTSEEFTIIKSFKDEE